MKNEIDPELAAFASGYEEPKYRWVGVQWDKDGKDRYSKCKMFRILRDGSSYYRLDTSLPVILPNPIFKKRSGAKAEANRIVRDLMVQYFALKKD